jgi:excisionase family DNA binding protein
MYDYDYPVLLTLKEAAYGLRVSPTTLRRLIRRGQFPGLRIGREFRIREDDLQKVLETRKMTKTFVSSVM